MSAERARLSVLVAAIALAIGLAIAYVDSRTTWDDAGVTAAALFITSAVLAATSPRSAWVIGLVVGLPVVVFNIALHGNVGSWVALVVSLAGAGLGRWIGKAFRQREIPGST